MNTFKILCCCILAGFAWIAFILGASDIVEELDSIPPFIRAILFFVAYSLSPFVLIAVFEKGIDTLKIKPSKNNTYGKPRI